ncbi:hypothetical protein BAE44_0024422 [Dichanthelium oligosanthes]|uniref:Uncharacterized protein n=1 Tax=Dichanthelium oligosanthes TaxID=888268 RepID=A0A1E5UNV1_9POAL|nr:hypothetical protein BAE44_0024422 [Dichanthelium oligosanthes]
MVSWHFDRHRTTFKGSFSHNERGHGDIADSNPHGYNFTGIEVNISSEAGSSGAPLVDLASEVVGGLHDGRVGV